MFPVIAQPGNQDFLDGSFGGIFDSDELMIVSVAELTIIRDACKE